jgi:chemotaxis protein histidine kinase CheA
MRDHATRLRRKTKQATFYKVWKTLDRLAEQAEEQRKETDKRLAAQAEALRKEAAEQAAALRKETEERLAAHAEALRKEAAAHAEALRKEAAAHAEALRKETEEQRKEIDKRLAAQAEALRKEIAEVEKQHKETEKAIGRLGNRIGEIAERLLTPGLICKFKKIGIKLKRIRWNHRIEAPDIGVMVEIDTMLEGDRDVVVVEVKVQLSIDDVKYHLRRMEKLQRFATATNDTRKLYGAVASTVMNDNVKKFARAHGLFVIEPAGYDVTLTKPFHFAPPA